MIAIDDLDYAKVANELNVRTNTWSSEGEGRKYVKVGDKFAVTKGRYGLCMTRKEWGIALKLLNGEVLDTIKDFMGDFADLDRMGVEFGKSSI